jgi:hypothetical protein
MTKINDIFTQFSFLFLFRNFYYNILSNTISYILRTIVNAFLKNKKTQLPFQITDVENYKQY